MDIEKEIKILYDKNLLILIKLLELNLNIFEMFSKIIVQFLIYTTSHCQNLCFTRGSISIPD